MGENHQGGLLHEVCLKNKNIRIIQIEDCQTCLTTQVVMLLDCERGTSPDKYRRWNERFLIDMATGHVSHQPLPDCYYSRLLEGGQYLVIHNDQGWGVIRTDTFQTVETWFLKGDGVPLIYYVLPTGPTSFVLVRNDQTLLLVNFETGLNMTMTPDSRFSQFLGLRDALFIHNQSTGVIEVYETRQGQLVNQIAGFTGASVWSAR